MNNAMIPFPSNEMEILLNLFKQNDFDSAGNFIKSHNIDISHALLFAAGSDCIIEVFIFLGGLGADVNYQEVGSGNTALHIASALGRGIAMMYLLSQGCDVHVVNAKGESALFLYTRYCSVVKEFQILVGDTRDDFRVLFADAMTYNYSPEERKMLVENTTPDILQMLHNVYLSMKERSFLPVEILAIELNYNLLFYNTEQRLNGVGSIMNQGIFPINEVIKRKREDDDKLPVMKKKMIILNKEPSESDEASWPSILSSEELEHSAKSQSTKKDKKKRKKKKKEKEKEKETEETKAPEEILKEPEDYSSLSHEISSNTLSSAEEDVFEVEDVLERRENRKTGKAEYLIKWSGFDDNHASWEPEENLSKGTLQMWRKKQKPTRTILRRKSSRKKKRYVY
eukprot:TRINITY_DN5117_c0_g1_i1.p1 TRINITY_DN5117_c0_g1~~TRINITY_DN5117_c0_g1_i1.p1  ORF type:complete len:421 (+),score=112.38 TRINITY_DN5117_c0_g1_i1:72-1265(+)